MTMNPPDLPDYSLDAATAALFGKCNFAPEEYNEAVTMYVERQHYRRLRKLESPTSTQLAQMHALYPRVNATYASPKTLRGRVCNKIRMMQNK